MFGKLFRVLTTENSIRTLDSGMRVIRFANPFHVQGNVRIRHGDPPHFVEWESRRVGTLGHKPNRAPADQRASHSVRLKHFDNTLFVPILAVFGPLDADQSANFDRAAHNHTKATPHASER